jgi:hypothetical protein
MMTRLEKIQYEIKTLSREEYTRLRLWFSERDWQEWDRQIERDAESGQLNFLIQEAFAEKALGRLNEL